MKKPLIAAGTVLKGDRITYTQETDEVEAVGNARISRQGASFSGPSMRFKISPRTGDMSDAEYEYAPRNIRNAQLAIDHAIKFNHTPLLFRF